MAEQNSEDRNLPASQRKLIKARAEGQVTRSRDLGHLITLGSAAALLVTFSPWLADWLKQMLMQSLSFDRSAVLSTGVMGEELLRMTLRLLMVLVPAFAVMMAAGVASNLAIGGWNFTLQPMMPNFGKLNPLVGLPGILSTAKLVNTLKGCALAIVLGTIGAVYLKGHLGDFFAVLSMPLQVGISHAASTLTGGLALLLIAVALCAAIDVPLQLHQHAQRLKMSHQERKQEHKELEGNKEVKAKIRSKMREMTRRRMLAAVPTADLVVMNPTHYAVALKYDDRQMGAPRVVAKGTDLLAMKIRDLASGASVPVLQAPALARALYAHAELDQEIPAALFAAVAQVLAYVYQLRSALAGLGAMPPAVPEVSVPPELDPHLQPTPKMESFE
jgi:flagellar biosynthetic protein FlhB